MAEEAQAPEQGATPENGSTGADYAQVLERLSQFDSTLDERVAQAVQGALPQQAEEEPEPEFEDPYSEVQNMYEDPDEAQAVRGVLQGIVDKAVQQHIQQQVSPLAQQFRQLRTELDVGELEEQYPELREKPEVAEQMAQSAQELAKRLGNPDLMYDRQILEMAYLADRARRMASSEGPAGGSTAGLESAAGAAAPAEPTSADFAKEIVKGYRQNSGSVFGI